MKWEGVVGDWVGLVGEEVQTGGFAGKKMASGRELFAGEWVEGKMFEKCMRPWRS